MGGNAAFLSENHDIPLMGFILQPSVIPSSDLEAVTPIDSHAISFMDNLEKNVVGHGSLKKLKAFFETNPIWGALNTIRARYKLPKQKKGTWHYFQKLDVPLIIPIRQYAFGDRPKDWKSNTVFTDFIYLRTPMDKVQSLNKELTDFFAVGGEMKERPTILIAFSSMPVGLKTIVKIIVKMATQCEAKPRIIGVTGVRPNEDLGSELQKS